MNIGRIQIMQQTPNTVQTFGFLPQSIFSPDIGQWERIDRETDSASHDKLGLYLHQSIIGLTLITIDSQNNMIGRKNLKCTIDIYPQHNLWHVVILRVK